MKKFKEYNQNQMMLFPPHLTELIPKNHPVRVVNDIIEKLDLKELQEEYNGGGAPSYDPKMMLKVLIYAYTDRKYTTRPIKKALHANIHYMWLSGMQYPDHRTINNFRLRLKKYIKKIFKEIALHGEKLGLVEWLKLSVDGTKQEANGNKHKMIWRKNTERYKKSVEEKIERHLEEIEKLNENEKELYGDDELYESEKMSAKALSNQVENVGAKINEAIRKKTNSKTKSGKVARYPAQAKKLKQIKNAKTRHEKEIRKLKERKEKYEKQEDILSKRNSYSKTDEDATAMKMKNSDEIKPGYNILIGAENQFVVDYTVEQQASDGACFTNLMTDIKKTYDKQPENVIGDSAFGNEENYDYCAKNRIKGYLKYQTYHLEKRRKFYENKFRKVHFTYDKKNDCYICPHGKRLYYERTNEEITKTGYRKKIKIYECSKRICNRCKNKKECCKGDGGRTISRSEKYEKYKIKAKRMLDSPKGQQLRKIRGVEVETPFANIKYNHKFQRHVLRGLEMVIVETGLHIIAHNIGKIIDKTLEKLKKWGNNVKNCIYLRYLDPEYFITILDAA